MDPCGAADNRIHQPELIIYSCERWCAQPLGCTRHATRGSLEVTMLGGLGGQSLGLHRLWAQRWELVKDPGVDWL